MTDQEQGLPREAPRYRRIGYDFFVPEQSIIEESDGIIGFTITKLTGEEELLAASRSGGQETRNYYELAKLAIRRVYRAQNADLPIAREFDKKGQPLYTGMLLQDEANLVPMTVSSGDGSVDIIWENPECARLRTLVVSAYQVVNGISKATVVAFHQSRRTSTL